MSDLVEGQKAKDGGRTVLAEETFIADLGKIIERDFLPDLPRLRAKQRYLEAREGALAAAAAAAGGAASAAGYSTPTPVPTPAPTPAAASGEASLSSRMSTVSGATAKAAAATAMSGISLDSYLCANTSEDNASFQALLDESERRRRIKYAWFYDREKASSAPTTSDSVKAIEGGGGERAAIQEASQEGGGTTAGLDSWQGYRVLNAFMYAPGSEIAASSKTDPTARSGIEGRRIVHENTRFRRDPFRQGRSVAAAGQRGQVAALPVSLSSGGGAVTRFGTDGLELRHPAASSGGNAAAAAAAAATAGVPAYLATPSPAPGVGESPLMTWGDIDGTPFRIDEDANSALLESAPSATSAATDSLPYFRIPARPTVQLADKLRRQRQLARQRDLAANAGRREASVGKSPSRLAMGLSPAARQLLKRAAGIGLGGGGGSGGGGAGSSVDKALRASYRGGDGGSTRMSSSGGSSVGGNSSRRSTSSASYLTDGLLLGGGGGRGGAFGTPGSVIAGEDQR